jgi:hypothetical protein
MYYVYVTLLYPHSMGGGYIAITLSVCPSVRLSIRSHFRNRYLCFYWKKWFYIWYMALAWWLVPCLPFPGLQHIYFLFTERLTNERVGVFLARRSVQHLVETEYFSCWNCELLHHKAKSWLWWATSFQYFSRIKSYSDFTWW